MQNSSISSFEKKYTRNANAITLGLMISTLPSAALFLYFGYVNNLPQLYIPAVTLLTTFFFDFYPLSLISRGRKDLAMMLVITAFLLNVLIVPFVVQGLGLVIAASIFLVVISIVGLTLAPRYSTSGIVVAVMSGILAFGLDAVLGADRIRVAELERYTPYILGLIAIPIVIVFFREFNRFSLQTKITLGILLTGGITVATLVVFGLNRLTFLGGFLSGKYEDNVMEKTEADILRITTAEAEKIDRTFLEIQNDLLVMAEYRAELSRQKPVFGTGSYWNAAERVLQLSGGQYGNSSSDPSSIFIPNQYMPSEEMLADMNVSAHLDLVAPGILESHSEVAAVYFISKLGYTVYYPNISLAENVPPDFDPTQQPFYTIANPSNNPERLPRLTLPYNDPAGTGLIVTLSVPVYNGNTFEGVIGADVQLARIISSVSQIQSGFASGVSFLVDGSGLIISMNEAGYQYFGLQPEIVPFNENPKQTIFDAANPELQEVAEQIFNSQTGLSQFDINGVDTYVSVSALESSGYKLVFLAPASELNREVIALREDVNAEIALTFQRIAAILGALFLGAFIVSLVVGQIITRPLKRLTETVEQIAGGNLSSRASVETEDETGILARSFNTMADQLTETLQGLEDRIAERTSELEVLNKSNAYRATLFESIARISRIISSTRSLEQLLPQITETISTQLGYYHVGIFLMDAHSEYAILEAANSDGGKMMLARGHRLRVGETGLVGYVTESGSPRVALDVGQDAVFFNNPDLPETHSEIALPLRSGSEIIGALDVQSKLTNAFTDEDVNILSVLADQVSIAIQNARSFQQSLEALEKAERAAAQLSEQQWKQFNKKQALKGFHFDGVNTQEVSGKQASPQPNHVSIPILSRGVQIGTLKLSAPDPDRKWDNNELALAQATAERTALAIETAHLLEDARKRASKEQTIGQISAKIGSLVNIDNIVQTTVQELGNNLPGTEVAIQFKSGQSGT